MMRILILFTISLLLSCQKEQDEPIAGNKVLHYDGVNQSAPVIARGISYPYVTFPASEIAQRGLTNRSLVQVEFYIDQRPESAKLLIFDWNQVSPDEPGNLIYESVLPRLTNNSWNLINLSENIPLSTPGIWIAFEINAGDNDLRVIGCDPGPRHPRGDGYGLFGSSNAPGWTHFFKFSNQTVNINWNIRGITE